MKELGIAIFSGLEQTVEQNLNYLHLARRCGYSRLFTSLHIPESDASGLVQDTRRVLACAAELGYFVTADISPATWQQFGIGPAQLKTLGIATVRIDYGVSLSEMRAISESANVNVEVNASVLSQAGLALLFDAGFAAERLSACHNYYPRPETGLSFSLLIERSRPYLSHGIPVGAFIPNRGNPRGPIFAGLPTVEEHRRLSAVEAARQLWASGVIDTIFWGDSLVSETALRSIAGLPRLDEPIITMRLIIESETVSEQERALVFLPVHTNRCDAAAVVIRSQETRNLCRRPVPPHDHRCRRRGDVTVDNVNYGRYMGEVQIVLQDLPTDDRVNIIGRIADEDLCMLECLFPGRQFCFSEVTRS